MPDRRLDSPVPDRISGTGIGTAWDYLWSQSRPSPDSDQLKYAPFCHAESIGKWRGAEGGGRKQVSVGGCHKGQVACTYHVGGLAVGGWWGMKRGGV